jgi:hypothetical protein
LALKNAAILIDLLGKHNLPVRGRKALSLRIADMLVGNYPLDERKIR